MAVIKTFKGYLLTIPETVGTYSLVIDNVPVGKKISNISVVADKYASGDSFKIKHLDGSNDLVLLLVDDHYSIPRDFPWNFSFTDKIELESGHKLKLIYSHTNIISLNVFVYLTLESE